MAKEINEKTFEINITNELLNLSKSFLWYLDHSPLCHLLPRNTWAQFLNQSVLFAEGLTQEEESNALTGGYDVSISYTLPNGLDGRLMFLQYKAGVRKQYSNRTVSQFYRPTAIRENREPQHVLFNFNDAADGTQHSTLRYLANLTEIQSESVMYVFPRITEQSDFRSKVGSLISHSSFVPVLELDNQAFSQTPSISINDGDTHKYRTSYDGQTSEVNFFFFFFFYDNRIASEFLSELICIQIERYARILIKQNRPLIELFLDVISVTLSRFVETELKQLPLKSLLTENISSYVRRIEEEFNTNKIIPEAPSKYTTKIPKEGLKLILDDKNDFSSINYQLF